MTSRTGIFEDVVPVGAWEWHVSGVITVTRIPTLDVQTNMLAALQNSALIQGAQEEVVLTGQFIPEPTTLVLLTLGSVMVVRRRRSR